METRSNHVLVGSVVLALIAAIMIAAFWFSRIADGEENIGLCSLSDCQTVTDSPKHKTAEDIDEQDQQSCNSIAFDELGRRPTFSKSGTDAGNRRRNVFHVLIMRQRLSIICRNTNEQFG